MLHVNQINDVSVKPIQMDTVDKTKIRGFKMFGELYSNVFICARKKMGKTTVIWNILKNCCGRDTKLIIFCATVNKDDSYKHIIEYFQGKGNEVSIFTSIKDGKEDNLINVIEQLRQPAEESESESSDQMPFIITENQIKELEKKPRKEKLKSPEIIFIFDDLSKELQLASVSMLLKSNRHYKAKVILSSQYIHDLRPESILQLDYLLLFSNITQDKLQVIHSKTDISITLSKFEELYKFATMEKYSFLYIDIVNGTYRVRFNKLITIA